MADNSESQIQTTSDSSAQQVGQDDQNQSEADSIASLRRKKRICKTQLTKSKLLLTSLLCASDRNVDNIRSAVDNVLRLNEEVINILEYLCEQKAEFEEELEAVQADNNVADLLSRATNILCNVSKQRETLLLTPDSVSLSVSPSPRLESNDNQPNSVPTVIQNGGASPATESSQVDRDLFRHLSKVSIIKFNGNKRDYRVFKDAFTECIDKTSISKAYKMLHLRQLLTGDALKSVEGFPASDNGYDAALKRLEDKFGGERRAVLIHLDNIRLMSQVNFSDLKKFEEFVDTLELCILSLKDSGRTEEFNENSMFFSVARSKLSTNNVMQFKRWAAHEKKEQSLLTMFEWLSLEVRYRTESQEEVEGFNLPSKPVLTSSSSRQSGNTFQPRNRYGRNSKTFALKTNTPKLCIACNHSHEYGLNNCTYFKSLSVSQRWAMAKDKRLCFRCLGHDHRGSKCNKVQQCAIEGCTRTHHFLLHASSDRQILDSSNCGDPRQFNSNDNRLNIRNQVQEDNSRLTESDQTSFKHTHTQIRKSTAMVMRVVPVILRNYNRVIQCNALMDDCSTDSYINSNIAAELGLFGEIADLNVCVLGGKSTSLNSTFVSLEVCSLDYKTCIPVTAFTVNNVTGDLRTVNWNEQAQFWPHLQGIPFPKIMNYTVDLLIGLNVAGVHRAITEISGLPHEPVARLTPLGWTCIGSAEPFCSKRPNYAHFAYYIKTESDVDTLIRNMWNIENSGLKPKHWTLTKSESDAIESTNESLVYDSKDNRYTVGIPWNSNYRKLLTKSNFENAKLRLLSLERSLSKRPEIAVSYSDIIREHLQKGYISEVPTATLPSWYLPHFAVVRMDKATTKVRMVLDAAARTDGLSLNDCINPGPKLQRELVDVILRFRLKPVCLVADISQMFHQISLKPDDRKFHRFLWRDNYQSPIKIYEYNRLVFGNSSSPYLSQAVLRKHCESNASEYPLAAESVLASMYVDDLLDSVDTVSEAIELRQELTNVLLTAGFEIRKWMSNKQEVLAEIPISDRLNRLSLDDSNLPSVKTLGILWSAETDTFTFEVTNSSCATLTKRIVVSRTATLFDPLNLIAPFSIRAKIGIQKTWVCGLDWDTPLPVDLAEQWQSWFSELPLLINLEIPRCLVKGDKLIVFKSVHVFVDASEKCYATCCYLRCKYDDESVSVELIVAKTRVAPLKALSIPKLELCGAVLGTRLAASVCDVYSIPTSSVTFWCDSQNVLYWIKGESFSYKPFVSHRVGEIHELSEPSQWRYVPTKLNSADLATRGMSALDLSESQLWWHGPEYLALEPNLWPDRVVPEPAETALAEIRSNTRDTFLVTKQPCDLGRLDPNRYSNWLKLIRVTSFVRRFVYNIRNPGSRISGATLTVGELDKSETFWFKVAQRDFFSDEIRSVQLGDPIRSNSKLITLNPYLDNDGLLRVNGRIGKSKHLSYAAKFPIILPAKHRVSNLIATSYHEDGNHDVGTSHVLSLLRSKFWIVHARSLIKSIKASCTECSRRRRKPAAQVMAPLPECRLGAPLRAFAKVGIDYAGPFLTKQGRGKIRTKRYLCLITCLATRAVHLELAWSMDTESFLCAFSRFTNRRGRPISVVSDNGTNFVGAERELGDLIRALDQTKIGNSLANNSIEWMFNPPLSPHFGGVFEAMVKSAKRAIKAIIGNADVSDEELATAFVKAEGLINSRPLSYQGDDSNDSPVLTPNHFLFGQISGQLAPECVDDYKFDPRKRWRRVQDLIKHFWQRWMKEILPTLNARSKWHREHRDFAVGDVAIVVDPQNPRGKWPLGRIVKVFHGDDKHVRVVEIKIGDKIYKRSICHLCPLDTL